MLRHLGLIVVCACIVASVGCDGGKVTAPAPPPPPSTVTVQFGGRVVNADAGGAVANVGVSLYVLSSDSGSPSVFPKNTATSGGDGTFTLPLDLPSFWRSVSLKLTAPPGYDDTHQRFEPATAAERPAIRMYPTLVIRPGESIEVRVEPGVNACAFGGGFDCRRVLVEASPGEPVELEIVPHDTSKPMGLVESVWDEEPVLRLTVAGGVAYVYNAGTARLTARR